MWGTQSAIFYNIKKLAVEEFITTINILSVCQEFVIIPILYHINKNFAPLLINFTAHLIQVMIHRMEYWSTQYTLRINP